MAMTLTHPGAPGHLATATEDGWQCSCGAGNRWEDGPRPRVRAVGGARRHLTAAARNNPYTTPQAAAEAAAETRAVVDAYREARDAETAAEETPAPEPEAPQDAEPEPEPERPAPVSLVNQFRSPPRQDGAS